MASGTGLPPPASPRVNMEGPTRTGHCMPGIPPKAKTIAPQHSVEHQEALRASEGALERVEMCKKEDPNLVAASVREKSTCGNCGVCPKCVAHQLHVEDEEMSELGYVSSWPEWRSHAAKVLGNPIFDCFLCAVVFYNLIVVVAETDHNSKHGKDSAGLPWVDVSNTALLVFYTVEMGFRIAVYGRHFIRDHHNYLDVTIIGFDLCMLPVTYAIGDVFSVSFLRVFRLARLGRSWRLMKLSPELAILLKGLASTAKSIFVGTILIFVMLTVSSIVAVEFIHPVNMEVLTQTSKYDGCDRCERAYASVMEANLTFFQQLIAGDSWGAVTIPVIEQNPWTAIFFVFVHVSVAIGLMNLLLAVIVDRANAARAEDKKALLKEEAREKKQLGKHLMEVCGALDSDGSQTLSLAELVEGFQENDDFQTTMQAMDIGEEDISAVFNILDSDGSGSVHYEEFVEQLWKMKSTDQQTMLIFIKYYVCDIRNKQVEFVKGLEQQLLKDYTAIRGMLTNLLNDATKELADLAQIETDLEGKKSPQKMIVGAEGPQEEAKQVSMGGSMTQDTLDVGQDLIALRSANEATSSTVKQCLSQLQQLTLALGAASHQAQDRSSLWPWPVSCAEVNRAPVAQNSLLVVPQAPQFSSVPVMPYAAR